MVDVGAMDNDDGSMAIGCVRDGDGAFGDGGFEAFEYVLVELIDVALVVSVSLLIKMSVILLLFFSPSNFCSFSFSISVLFLLFP